MSLDLTFRLAVAITRGAIVMTRSWSVGTYSDASTPPGEVRFACLDLRGVPSRAFEVWDEPYLLAGEVYGEETHGTDWSAFGAARRFVKLAGREAVEDALAKLHEGTRETLPMGEPAPVAVPSCA